MSAGRHASLARILAPAALLLAVTIAVLLVRAGLQDGEPAGDRPGITAVEPRFHVVTAGETLASIASRYGVDVDQIRDLNPGIDPVSLAVGSRVRVR